jgi:hypothetical protein
MRQVKARAEPEQLLRDVFTSQASHMGTDSSTARGPWGRGPRTAGITVDRLSSSFWSAQADRHNEAIALVVTGLLGMARAIPWWLFALVIALGVVFTR